MELSETSHILYQDGGASTYQDDDAVTINLCNKYFLERGRETFAFKSTLTAAVVTGVSAAVFIPHHPTAANGMGVVAVLFALKARHETHKTFMNAASNFTRGLKEKGVELPERLNGKFKTRDVRKVSENARRRFAFG